jgi:seryl-tRNA synthetase
MGPSGLRARTGHYESVVDSLGRWISGQTPETVEVFRFPPLMSRGQIERSGYLKSFPNLLGCVCCLTGGEEAVLTAVSASPDPAAWVDSLAPSDLVLTPASCYPIYPIAAARGAAPANGWTFDVGCECFRREPSQDLDRLQSFRMREFVRIGTSEQVQAFRAQWLAKADGIAEALGLAYSLEVANDPFFGRLARFMAASQRHQSLKFELLVPVISDEKPTACMSFNYHQSHLAEAWDLRLEDGAHAETACIAFGMDRLAMALFAHHGLAIRHWPIGARRALQL